MRRLLLSLVALSALCAAPVQAAETGSISGTVKDSTGGVLPAAAVTITGANLPGGRETRTTQSGDYNFVRLLPGVYTVEASLTDLGKASRSARVYVDRDTTVDLTLSPTASEEVTVTADAPVVDLRNTEVNFNFTGEQIQTLPLERTYRGLFQLIPGVADNRSTVGPSAGGSRQDNTYLMDGVNITNPGFGYLSTEVNELDVAEFNVKRGAISAEFGRSAGVVTNAVSRSGTNELHGAARFEWMPEALVSDFDEPAFRDSLLTTIVNPAVGIGGPFVRNKLFWYGSARYFRETRWERENRIGEALRDEVRTGHELYGKLTATPNQRHLINVSFRDRPNDLEGASLTSLTAPTRSTTDTNSSRIATASWAFFPTPRTSVDVKFLYLKERNESNPDTDLGYLEQPFDAADPTRSGQFTNPATGLTDGGFEYSARINYTRREIKAVVSQFFDLGRTGHQLKLGGGYEFGEEDFFRLANGWGQISRITASGQPRLRARYYFEQPPQLGQGRTLSLFAQDTVTIGQRFTLNAGLLLNRDEYAQDLAGSGGCPTPVNTPGGTPGGAAVFESDGDRCTFIRFGFGDQVQPRVGFNFNLREGKGDKVYANYGRYYNLDQKSSGRSLAPRRIFQREALFDLAGNLISDGPRASTTGKLIDKDLKPTYNDEFLAGYATPIGGDWGLDLFFQYRNTENFIEDLPGRPVTTSFAVGNLPCDTFDACRGIEATRKYKAVTFEVTRRMQDDWSLNASYTRSRLEGNFDLDYAVGSVFNTSSFIQDGPGTNVQEDGRDGVLREDRPHVFKLFLNYRPAGRLTLGGYLRVQSGAPWNARGQDTQGGAALFYLEPAGSHRNPTWTNLDLRGAYEFRLGGGTGLTVEARLLNVFNNQTQLSTDSVQFNDTVTVSTPPFVLPGRIPNAFFGTGNGFAPPRRLLLAARLDF